MTRNSMTVLALGLVVSLAGWGWSGRDGVERAAVGEVGTTPAPNGWTAPPGGHVTLPPGHPPVNVAPGALPPGHPPVGGSATCPGGGLARQPEGRQFRDFGDEPDRIIGI
jgi:hypothetical protein